MADQATLPTAGRIDHAAVDRAHALADREARLEHARMGRSVCEWRDGKVVWLTPAEIFAGYGLDENGRARSNEEPGSKTLAITDPDVLAPLEQFAWLDRLQCAGQLNRYRGEYLIAGAGQIFAHGPSLLDARREAEPKAAAAGIPPERLAGYFVPTNA
jgi:hypothetical protein